MLKRSVSSSNVPCPSPSSSCCSSGGPAETPGVPQGSRAADLYFGFRLSCSLSPRIITNKHSIPILTQDLSFLTYCLKEASVRSKADKRQTLRETQSRELYVYPHFLISVKPPQPGHQCKGPAGCGNAATRPAAPPKGRWAQARPPSGRKEKVGGGGRTLSSS